VRTYLSLFQTQKQAAPPPTKKKAAPPPAKKKAAPPPSKKKAVQPPVSTVEVPDDEDDEDDEDEEDQEETFGFDGEVSEVGLHAYYSFDSEGDRQCEQRTTRPSAAYHNGPMRNRRW
jgi:hypothetical protein